MNGEDVLGIGAFALLRSLTISLLRHYDEIGLLEPALVDPSTRYRYYRPEQVQDAQVVVALRALDLPLNEIKDILDGRDDFSTRAYLVAHRGRLSARAQLLTDQLATLDRYIEKGVSMPAAKGNRIVMINIAVDELESSRQFYEEALGLEFAEERHGDGPVHLNATFGKWNTDSGFLVAL